MDRSRESELKTKVSALQSRIDKGLADPISAKERELVFELGKKYERKYGKLPVSRSNGFAKRGRR